MATDIESNVQFLGFVKCPTCRNCGAKVKWKVRSTYRTADGRHRIQYLRCPVCGNRATRLVDVPDGE